MENRSSHEGQPGEPGQAAEGHTGGAGGAGGVGGVGYDTGGAGGTGGRGGASSAKREHDVQVGLRWVFVTTIGLFAVVLALGGWFKYDSLQKDHQIRHQARVAAAQADRSTNALCAFDRELQSRADRQEEALARTDTFIAEHPNGIPGISIKLLRQSRADDAAGLRNLRNTIKSLDVLNC
jgi:hypothetical protein